MDKHKINYIKRTLKHIRRVQDNALYLIENHSETLDLDGYDCDVLLQNILVHDSSKWSVEELEPYINKFNRKIDDGLFEKAWEHHYLTENHHINRGKVFNKLEMIEVICDLQAMSQEFNEDSCDRYFHDKWMVELKDWCTQNDTTEFTLYFIHKSTFDLFMEYMQKIINCFKRKNLKKLNSIFKLEVFKEENEIDIDTKMTFDKTLKGYEIIVPLLISIAKDLDKKLEVKKIKEREEIRPFILNGD